MLRRFLEVWRQNNDPLNSRTGLAELFVVFDGFWQVLKRLRARKMAEGIPHVTPLFLPLPGHNPLMQNFLPRTKHFRYDLKATA